MSGEPVSNPLLQFHEDPTEANLSTGSPAENIRLFFQQEIARLNGKEVPNRDKNPAKNIADYYKKKAKAGVEVRVLSKTMAEEMLKNVNQTLSKISKAQFEKTKKATMLAPAIPKESSTRASSEQIDLEETIRLLEKREEERPPNARYDYLEYPFHEVDFSQKHPFKERYPHLALRQIISKVSSKVDADLIFVGANDITITFNPYLTQERVANFCKKWGKDLNNKVVLAYHGTKDELIDTILEDNLKTGSRGLYGEGSYLSTHVETALNYANIRGKIKKILGFLVVVNKDTVVNGVSAQGIRRPTDYIIVQPHQSDALLPLFTVECNVKRISKQLTSPLEMVDGIPFSFREGSRYTMRFGGKKRKKTRSQRHFSRSRVAHPVTASRLFRVTKRRLSVVAAPF